MPSRNLLPRLLPFMLLMSACTQSDDKVYGALHGQTAVVGTSSYVTVSTVPNEAEALPLAKEHCAKFGKFAFFKSIKDGRANFDCTS